MDWDDIIFPAAVIAIIILLGIGACVSEYFEYKEREQYYECVFSLKGSMSVGGSADIQLLCSHD